MATNNAINISAAGLVNYDGAGTFTGVTVTQNAILVGGAANTITSLALTNGQLAIGSTGASPSAATISSGTGISVNTGAGSITISSTGGGLTWNDIGTTSVTAAADNGYQPDNVSLVTITLPTFAPQFSVVAIAGRGNGGWKIAQNAGQNIQFGKQSTTSGVTGFLASTNQYDCVYLLCTVTSTTFTVLNAVGNLTVN